MFNYQNLPNDVPNKARVLVNYLLDVLEQTGTQDYSLQIEVKNGEASAYVANFGTKPLRLGDVVIPVGEMVEVIDDGVL